MKKLKLLSRDAFRSAVFSRDDHKCVFCKRSADQTPEGKLDAHHIIERRCWTDPAEFGGYIVENGVTVCEDHHRQCESTVISCDECREAARIEHTIIPSHLYGDQVYTKWGDVILPNGTRLKGELFHDDSVQKVLATGGVLDLYIDRVKYPRTNHLAWSPGMNGDDRLIPSMDAFVGRRVIVTEKIDGENSTIGQSYTHARSVNSGGHPSRNLLKAFASKFQHDIPDGWRLCGENAYAVHSIAYDDLPHHFLGFSVWDDRNECLSWDDTLLYFDLLGIKSVPVLYDGIYDEKIIRGLWSEDRRDVTEGYVLRVADSFPFRDFRKCVAKFVRANHVAPNQHNWAMQAVVPNGFREKF